MMENKKNTTETLKWERVENLMLMSVLGQEPFRSQALEELKRRRLVKNANRFFDAFMTDMGVVC
jgi:hypothetical protein